MSLERIKNELQNHGYEKALAIQAEKDDVTAQLYLGICYKYGIQRPKNLIEAIRLFTLAAEAGNITAECCLGISYLDESDLRVRNKDKALELLHSAANKGDEDAQAFLGVIYNNGLTDVAKDITKAIHFLKMGVAQNNLICKVNLASIHIMRRFDGFPQDQKEGFTLAKSAADQGEPLAMSLLGNCYRDGFGVPIDAKEASKWYSLSIQNGNDVGGYLWNLFECHPDVPEIIYRAAKGCASIEAKQSLNQLAIQQPHIFDDLAVADSLADLKGILSTESFHIVEKRRNDYALTIKNELSSYTPLSQDIHPEVISHLLPSSDVVSFFKRQPHDLEKNQFAQNKSLEIKLK
jgi:TPR repeat protein